MLVLYANKNLTPCRIDSRHPHQDNGKVTNFVCFCLRISNMGKSHDFTNIKNIMTDDNIQEFFQCHKSG
jgi:hypothetical protein